MVYIPPNTHRTNPSQTFSLMHCFVGKTSLGYIFVGQYAKWNERKVSGDISQIWGKRLVNKLKPARYINSDIFKFPWLLAKSLISIFDNVESIILLADWRAQACGWVKNPSTLENISAHCVGNIDHMLKWQLRTSNA